MGTLSGSRKRKVAVLIALVVLWASPAAAQFDSAPFRRVLFGGTGSGPFVTSVSDCTTVAAPVGSLCVDSDDGAFYRKTSGTGTSGWTLGSGGSGDVVGPASATDNAIVRFDSTTGKLVQNSGITIADGATGTLSGSNSGDVTLAGTPDYLTLSGQQITRGLIDLATDVTGTIPVANGGTNLTAATDDSVPIGNGTTWQAKTLADCDATTSKLLYDQTTNAFSCGTDQDNGAAASNYQTVADEGTGLTQRATINFTGAGVSCADNAGSTRTDCTIAGGGSGDVGLVLLESHTASASATVDFTTRNASGQSGATFQSDYDEYEIHLIGVLPANDGVTLQLTFSSNGGSSFIATGYGYIIQYLGWNGATGVINSISDSVIKLNGGVENTTSTAVSNSRVIIYNPGSSTRRKGVQIQSNVQATDGNYFAQQGAGFLADTSALNAFRISYSGGNIAEGEIRVYGVKK